MRLIDAGRESVGKRRRSQDQSRDDLKMFLRAVLPKPDVQPAWLRAMEQRRLPVHRLIVLEWPGPSIRQAIRIDKHSLPLAI